MVAAQNMMLSMFLLVLLHCTSSLGSDPAPTVTAVPLSHGTTPTTEMSLLPTPAPLKQLTLREYFQKRLESQSSGQVHTRHTLLTPKEIALDFMNWNEKAKEFKREGLKSTRYKAEKPSKKRMPESLPPILRPTTLPTPRKPLSNAIYSSSLDAMAINNNAVSSSNTMIQREFYTMEPFVVSSETSEWTPVTSSTRQTYRKTYESSEVPKFDGGGGGLDPKFMDRMPSYTYTDSFRYRGSKAKPTIQRNTYSEASDSQLNDEYTPRRYYNLGTSPQSRYRKKALTPQSTIKTSYLNSQEIESLESFHSVSPKENLFGEYKPTYYGSPELRWSDGSLINPNSFVFKQFSSPQHKLPQSLEAKERVELEHQITEPNYSYLDSSESNEYMIPKSKGKFHEEFVYKTSRPSYSNIDISKDLPLRSHFSVERLPPESKEAPKYTDVQSFRKKENKEKNDDLIYKPRSREKDPYNYKRDHRINFKGRYRTTTTTEKPRYFRNNNGRERNREKEDYSSNHKYSYEKDYNENRLRKNQYIDDSNNQIDDTNIDKSREYGLKYHEEIPHYSPEIDWSTEKISGVSHKSSYHTTPKSIEYSIEYNSRDHDGRYHKEISYYSPEIQWSSEKIKDQNHDLQRRKKESSSDWHRGKTTTEKNVSYEHTTETPEIKKLKPTYTNIDRSRRKPNMNNKSTKFDGYYTDEHYPKGHKNSESIEHRYRTRTTSRTKDKYSHQSQKNRQDNDRRTTTERPRFRLTKSFSTRPSRKNSSNSKESSSKIIDELSVHHLAGPPYHDSIPLNVVKDLKTSTGLGFTVITTTPEPTIDSYEAEVDEIFDQDNFFSLKDRSSNTVKHDSDTSLEYHNLDYDKKYPDRTTQHTTGFASYNRERNKNTNKMSTSFVGNPRDPNVDDAHSVDEVAYEYDFPDYSYTRIENHKVHNPAASIETTDNSEYFGSAEYVDYGNPLHRELNNKKVLIYEPKTNYYNVNSYLNETNTGIEYTDWTPTRNWEPKVYEDKRDRLRTDDYNRQYEQRYKHIPERRFRESYTDRPSHYEQQYHEPNHGSSYEYTQPADNWNNIRQGESHVPWRNRDRRKKSERDQQRRSDYRSEEGRPTDEHRQESDDNWNIHNLFNFHIPISDDIRKGVRQIFFG